MPTAKPVAVRPNGGLACGHSRTLGYPDRQLPGLFWCWPCAAQADAVQDQERAAAAADERARQDDGHGRATTDYS
jgi:hypothetical protein